MTRVAVFALLLTAATVAAAEPCADTASCLAAIEKAQADTQSFRADFTQVKHVSLLDEPIVSHGRISFRRPDRMRLEIRDPVQALVLINGRSFRIPGISDADAKAMSMAPVAGMFTQLGALFTGNSAALQRDFEVTANPGGDSIDVVLVPRNESWQRLFRRIDLRFAGSNLMTQQIGLEDSFGDRLEITLANVERNPSLPDSLFEESTTTPQPQG